MPFMSQRIPRVVAGIGALALVFLPHSRASATLPTGFQQSVVFSGLNQPTAVQFASDGRTFVAEKSGLIKVFDSLSATTPTIFADLRTNTHNYWDRGLLGLALHPDFPSVPYVYVLYTLDAPIGGTPPTWGSFGGTSDGCPDPPGGTTDGCVVAGRVSRLQASGDTMIGTEQVFVENWCQQFPGHSLGTIAFGPDGALYVSGGEGANFNSVDYGQSGYPAKNPCGDPPVGVGGVQTPPSAEGGSLRSQNLLTGADPVSYDGTVVRLDPMTGAAMPDDPLVGGTNASDDPIIAYGLRNPFRMTARPGTAEIWIGDVGWNTWEEIDRIGNATDTIVENFGWPCFEGVAPQPAFQNTGLALCQSLYAKPGTVTDPYYAYDRSGQIVPGEICGTGSASITGLAFYGTGSYPNTYKGALFFADYSRNCIWAMPLGASGDPDPSARLTFVGGAANPVDLEIGPGGDLFYVDYTGGTIRRISYVAGTPPPHAVLQADTTDGPTPLAVHLDGSGSSGPDPGDVLTYSWDFDGDGVFGDSTAVAPSTTYTTGGTYVVSLRVTDPHGATDTAKITITAGNTHPTATITSPVGSTTWKVGDTIDFSGSATDLEQGTLPASALTWTLIIQHCPSNCHAHTVQSFSGATGSFVAPDHEYPAHLEIQLTATDSGGLTDTKRVQLYPQTTDLTFDTSPQDLQIVIGATSATAPITKTVIVNSHQSISAPSPQTVGAHEYAFLAWSDGGTQSHLITAPATPATYTARFAAQCRSDADCDDGDPCTGDRCDATLGCQSTVVADGTGCGDVDVCNGAESCQAGICTAGTPLACDDGNPCTIDRCDPVTGCAAAPVTDGTPCADDDVCNGAETCHAGVCSPQTPLACDDQNPCTTDGCDPVSGCTAAPVEDGTPCSDGLVCDGAESCASGVCTPGRRLDCDDGDPCTFDSCSDASPGGCVHRDESAHVGSPRLSLLRPRATSAGRLTIAGAFGVSADAASALDPLAQGITVQIAKHDGTVAVRFEAPSGARNGRGTTGWVVNKSRTRWRYEDLSRSVGSVRTAQIRVRDVEGQKLVGFTLHAVLADDVVVPGDEPLTVETLVGGGALACGKESFSPAGSPKPLPVCAFNRTGRRLQCR
jgi:glucose/arabinose dehydrogenase